MRAVDVVAVLDVKRGRMRAVDVVAVLDVKRGRVCGALVVTRCRVLLR